MAKIAVLVVVGVVILTLAITRRPPKVGEVRDINPAFVGVVDQFPATSAYLTLFDSGNCLLVVTLSNKRELIVHNINPAACQRVIK